MAINTTDIKLYESQRLTDDPDGGGRATGIEVVDGAVNNLFPDISRLDRTVGRINLRKVFLGVATANKDTYLGAHAIPTKTPLDPKARVLIFNTGSESDVRDDARTYIENYVVQGAKASFELLGTQLQGQRVIVGIQREEQKIPEIGEVFMLVDGANSQYVRITDVESAIETFTWDTGSSFIDFQRRRLILNISSELQYQFPGGEAKPSGTTAPKSSVYATQVADAAKYFGATELAVAASIGDVTIKAASIFENLVPSAQSESSVLDAPAGYNAKSMAVASSAQLTETKSSGVYTDTTESGYFLTRPAMPGTVTVTIGGNVYTDNGDGTFTFVSGSDLYLLTIDYQSGVITKKRYSSSQSTSCTVVYTPAGVVAGPAETGSQEIDLQNRGYVYTLSLSTAKPRPGSLTIAYLALGKWVELRDLGSGVLEGEGTGTVNYQTGTVAMTLAALPDVGSKVVWSYQAQRVDEYSAGNETLVIEPTFKLQLDPGVKPTSVSLTWTQGGIPKTVTDNGAGVLTGDGTGWVIYATGEVELVLTSPPDAGTNITADAETVTNVQDVQSLSPDGFGVISGTIAGAPLLAGSVSVAWAVSRKSTNDSGGQWNQGSFTTYDIVSKRAQDDGAGGFVGFTGTINYTTGEFTLQVEDTYVFRQQSGGVSFSAGGLTTNSYSYSETVEAEALAGAVTFTFQEQAAVHAAIQSTIVVDELVFDLNDGSEGWLPIPGSLRFTYGGKVHYDIEGVIYRDLDAITGAGTAVGTIDHDAGEVLLSTWEPSPGNSVTVGAVLYGRGDLVNSYLVFRAPGRPLRPQSVQITAVRADTGDIITGTSDNAGVIDTAAIQGLVDYETGIIVLQFTDGVDDIPVWPGSVRYNAVIQSYLPLDPSLLGLDPVRLPVDGRVPIFRDGGVMVLSHTADTNIGTPANGAVINLARDHQAEIWVEDSLGVLMDPAQYSFDLLLGTVTFADPVTLQDADTNALTAPLHVKDRIEHMTAITDVQINGDLGMLAPLAHDYPVGSIISSALLWGDIKSRVWAEFTQKTWNSSAPNWTDARIGDDTTASYNLVDYPIEITNHGGITEKWALVFTASNAFNIVGEQVGIIGTGSTGADCAPVNPNTGVPYFIVRLGGWGTGWVSGNVLRFNTDGALAPMWIARTVLTGQATEDDDSFTLQARGDAD